MSCPQCKGDKLNLDVCMDDDWEWEQFFCLDCHYEWRENERQVYWE